MPPIEFSELLGCPFVSLLMSGHRASPRVRLTAVEIRGSGARSRDTQCQPDLDTDKPAGCRSGVQA
jgi:hypothetical protein